MAGPNPSNYHSEAMIAVSVVFLVLAWIAVALRFYVRGVVIRSLGWDDYVMALTLGAFTCTCSFLIFIGFYELQVSFEDVAALSKALEYVILIFAFYITTTMFVKISLAIFFLRVVIHRWQRWTIIISTAIFTTFCISFFFVSVFQCGMPSLYLSHKVQGQCISWNVLGSLNFVHGALNAVTDWIFVSMPVAVINNSTMNRRAKYTVVGVLMIGVLGSIASVARLPYINNLKSTADQNTFFANAPPIAMLSIIEPGMGIIAASMATLRPLFDHMFDRSLTFSSIGGSTIPPKTGPSVIEEGLESPGRSEFAAYGFDDIELKTRISSQATIAVVVAELPATPVTARFFQGRRSTRNSLMAELTAAKVAYNSRRFTTDGKAVAQLNLLLPDV